MWALGQGSAIHGDPDLARNKKLVCLRQKWEAQLPVEFGMSVCLCSSTSTPDLKGNETLPKYLLVETGNLCWCVWVGGGH